MAAGSFTRPQALKCSSVYFPSPLTMAIKDPTYFPSIIKRLTSTEEGGHLMPSAKQRMIGSSLVLFTFLARGNCSGSSISRRGVGVKKISSEVRRAPSESAVATLLKHLVPRSYVKIISSSTGITWLTNWKHNRKALSISRLPHMRTETSRKNSLSSITTLLALLVVVYVNLARICQI